jgi:hypothetical protein
LISPTRDVKPNGTDVQAEDMAVREEVYELLTGDDEGRVCKDIPDSACREQPGNFLKHVLSLAATKIGDGLTDSKLVLSWLLTALGAPVFLIGLLVPVREAGALLPQLFIAERIRAVAIRKTLWAAGSIVQGAAVLGMAAAALTLEGAVAGWAVIALLTVFALARSVCSIAYKDVLGKTVSKNTRGTATGTASTVAASVTLAFGLLLTFGILEKSVPVIAAVLVLGGALWLAGGSLFMTLTETPGATEGGANPFSVVLKQWRLLRDDGQLRRFIAARGLLLGTALGPPFLLAHAAASGDPAPLGLYILASGGAAALSGYVWGRLSDRSSRKALIAAGALGAVALATAALLPPKLLTAAVAATILFVLMIAHNGVRVARSTHLVDMAQGDDRSAYTALSNTIIGILLALAGLFGLIAQRYGEAPVLLVFAGMCAAAAIVAAGLDEVQEE